MNCIPRIRNQADLIGLKRKRLTREYEYDPDQNDEHDESGSSHVICRLPLSPPSSSSSSTIILHRQTQKLRIDNINTININININTVELQKEEPKGYIHELPKELFLKVISFIGPTSSTLIALSHVNKRYATMMKQVAEAMIDRAKVSYKVLLPPIHLSESITSLAIRHVRCFQDVMYKCNSIKKVLEKDFVHGCLSEAFQRGYISVEARHEIDAALTEKNDNSNNNNNNNTTTTKTNRITPVTIKEIDEALDIALDLLGYDNMTYFTKHLKITPEAIHPTFIAKGRHSLLEFFSHDIEHQVLSLCGKCGGKVFKYVKMMKLLQRSCRAGHQVDENNVAAAAAAAGGASNPLPLLLPSTRFQTTSTNLINTWKDEERFDRARLLMQLVVHRFVNMDTAATNERISIINDNESSLTSSSPSTLSTATNASVEREHHLPEDGEQQQGEDCKNGGSKEDDNNQAFYTWLNA